MNGIAVPTLCRVERGSPKSKWSRKVTLFNAASASSPRSDRLHCSGIHLDGLRVQTSLLQDLFFSLRLLALDVLRVNAEAVVLGKVVFEDN